MVLITTIKVTSNKDRVCFESEQGLEDLIDKSLRAFGRQIDRRYPHRTSLEYYARRYSVMFNQDFLTAELPSSRDENRNACLGIRIMLGKGSSNFNVWPRVQEMLQLHLSPFGFLKEDWSCT